MYPFNEKDSKIGAWARAKGFSGLPYDAIYGYFQSLSGISRGTLYDHINVVATANQATGTLKDKLNYIFQNRTGISNPKDAERAFWNNTSLEFSSASQGDITSMVIGSEGWYADITIRGLNIGGTYDFGWGANNTVGSNKLSFTVVSKSVTDAAVATTISRNVYGGEVVRTPYGTTKTAGSYTSGTFQEGETVTQAVSGATGIVVIGASAGPHLFIRAVTGTPNNSNIWTGGTSSATFTPTGTPTSYVDGGGNPGSREYYDGTSVTVRVSLTDYIYVKDKAGAGNSGTNVTYTVSSGFYTQSSVPNNSKSGTATNSSVAPYQPPVINWAWPGYQRVTGAFPLRAVGFQKDGQQGRSVKVVKFTVTDGSNTEIVYVTTPEIDGGMPDEVPVIEYIADFDANDFTQGAELTCNFEAFGWVGDTDSSLDTSEGTAQPTALPGPILLLCDKSGTYGVTMALVDAATGNDGTGVAYDSASFDEGTAAPFLTISGAAEAIAAYNNSNRSRNDVGAGEIRLKAGSYSWLGATDTYGNKPKTWLTITHAASTNAAGVDINGKTGATNISDMVKLYRVTLTNATNSLFSGIDSIWFDQVVCNTTGTGILAAGSIVYVTHCTLTDMQLQPSGVANLQFSILRGCEFSGSINRTAQFHTMIGNARLGKWTAGSVLKMDKASGSAAPLPICILAFNKIMGFVASGSASIFSAIDTSPSTTGQAIVQNIFEKCDDGPEALSNFIASESTSTNTPLDNVIVWHNTFVGGRTGYGYNSDGSDIKHRRYWSIKNNFFDLNGTKSDIFGTPDGNRVGNWPLVWQVGASGNVNGNNEDMGAVGFDFVFSGVKSLDPNAVDSTWAEFTDRKAWNGTVEGAGLGDYTPGPTSPLLAMSNDFVLPYDIEGSARSSGDAAGAITA